MTDFTRYMSLHQHGQEIDSSLWGVNQFPDGQLQFWIEQDLVQYPGNIDLDICLNSPAMMDLYRQIVRVIDLQSVFVTYLYGARSDKREAKTRRVMPVANLTYETLTEANGLGISLSSIQVFVPHSLPRKGLTAHIVDPAACPRDIVPPHLQPGMSASEKPISILTIFPDNSASLRGLPTYGPVEKTGVQDCRVRIETVTGTEVVLGKKRDQVTGRISSVVTKELADVAARYDQVYVIDDLCDGGATFVRIAERIGRGDLKLVVPHGVFSGAAIFNLKKAGFREIFTTNSYVQPTPELELYVQEQCHVMNIWRARRP